MMCACAIPHPESSWIICTCGSKDIKAINSPFACSFYRQMSLAFNFPNQSKQDAQYTAYRYILDLLLATDLIQWHFTYRFLIELHREPARWYINECIPSRQKKTSNHSTKNLVVHFSYMQLIGYSIGSTIACWKRGAGAWNIYYVLHVVSEVKALHLHCE